MAAMLLLAFGLQGAAWAENQFCDEPRYIMRSPAMVPERDLGALLTPAEKKDPGLVQKLLRDRKASGHSALGERFLARALGYSGKFETPDAAEEWLAGKLTGDGSYRKFGELWRKWINEPPTYLRAEVAQKDLALHSFFGGNRLLAAEFAQCLGREVAEARCEGYTNKRILPDARVYFGRATSREPCAIRYNGGLMGEPPDSIKVSKSSNRRYCMGYKESDCTEENDSRSWEWKPPSFKAKDLEATGAK